ncbi:CDP-glycerol glycerophosphotransferase family protein [Geodermatophilus marinus]|uniref:CDP-glycerol glycerophosphotransferase family protein n=1 Tax=Geodermatophilus sp. LHW52908 TaxID=2303986 RepID=UPI000E3BDBB9|nr:CDP-glycerol glycerophosphotransferase family protein [Geodermatophilus sp. LHW52908]RFU20900.1 CDP-glycerol glycerophosphotransferase family protein [Geodermatophilus sp. LHW52908]
MPTAPGPTGARVRREPPHHVVWSCFRGLYGDNPRALHEGWPSRGVPARHTWLCLPETVGTVPAGVTPVLYRTPEARAALESADVVVANDCLSMEWDKQPGTFYLQTWHGTPLKRIHHDVQPARPGWLDAADRDVARWDLLLSPNPVSTARLRGAFGYTGEVAETGYPRNDALSAPDRDAVRARVRARLGIPDGVTAVLYAPTWRDDLVLDRAGDAPDFELPVDLADFAGRLGGDHVLLVRLHNIVSGRLAVPPGLPVVDVTDDTDTAGLYLAADVLVTDYSSAMFDFAVTGRPILLFPYDLERYRDSLRGFYDDLEEIAPGPLLRTSAELVGAIRTVTEHSARWAGAYARFRDTFCSLEDGHATDRVLDLLFGTRPTTPPGRG